MLPEPDLYRKAGRLAPVARAALCASDRRIVVVGARGWIGRALLALLHEALGDEGLRARVVCFGSSAGTIEVEPGLTVEQAPLADLAGLPPAPSVLFHFAFLTKDKVAGMDAAAYEAANRAISHAVHDAAGPIGADRVFVASSGAAAFADREDAAADLRLYGRLKRDDEDLFARWAETGPAHRRAVIARIYALSGPYMNKHDTYALASFVNAALAGEPVSVRAPHGVVRAYVALRELLSLAAAALLAPAGPAVLRFDSGGEPMELAEVAGAVAALVPGAHAHRAERSSPREDRYHGDGAAYAALLAGHGIPAVGLADQLAETISFFRSRAPGCG